MLELKNISFNVADEKGEKDIITDVSLTVEDGKFLVITGPNGGGKSTLAKLIMGIEKPTGGQIIWNGTDITDMSITERAKLGIGYAFQHPPRFKGLSVRDLLSLAHGSDLPEDQCCAPFTMSLSTSFSLCDNFCITSSADLVGEMSFSYLPVLCR